MRVHIHTCTHRDTHILPSRVAGSPGLFLVGWGARTLCLHADGQGRTLPGHSMPVRSGLPRPSPGAPGHLSISAARLWPAQAQPPCPGVQMEPRPQSPTDAAAGEQPRLRRQPPGGPAPRRLRKGLPPPPPFPPITQGKWSLCPCQTRRDRDVCKPLAHARGVQEWGLFLEGGPGGRSREPLLSSCRNAHPEVPLSHSGLCSRLATYGSRGWGRGPGRGGGGRVYLRKKKNLHKTNRIAADYSCGCRCTLMQGSVAAQRRLQKEKAAAPFNKPLSGLILSL